MSDEAIRHRITEQDMPALNTYRHRPHPRRPPSYNDDPCWYKITTWNYQQWFAVFLWMVVPLYLLLLALTR